MTHARVPRTVLAALLVACGAAAVRADSGSGNGQNAITATARLDFVLNIGRFIFFRVGPRPYPNASTNPADVTITLQPSIPAVPTLPAVTANNVAVNWSGAAPTFAPVPMAVPVEVRTNAGQISIRANVVTALMSGSDNIPLSQIQVTSSDAGLPAPAIPNTGTGPSALVTGTAYGNLVTLREAEWTFTYNPAVLPPPGVYTGQISFTAVSP